MQIEVGHKEGDHRHRQTASEESSTHLLPAQWPSSPTVRFTSSRTNVDVQPDRSRAIERTTIGVFEWTCRMEPSF